MTKQFDDAENSAREQRRADRGRPFPKGRSGNPAGKPKGARNRTTLAAEELLEGEAKALTRKAIDMAKAGDVVAMRLCLDRLMPPRRARRVELPLPAISKPADLVTSFATIVQAMSEGRISPEEAEAMGSVLDQKRRALETVTLDERLGKIETRLQEIGK